MQTESHFKKIKFFAKKKSNPGSEKNIYCGQFFFSLYFVELKAKNAKERKAALIPQFLRGQYFFHIFDFSVDEIRGKRHCP